LICVSNNAGISLSGVLVTVILQFSATDYAIFKLPGYELGSVPFFCILLSTRIAMEVSTHSAGSFCTSVLRTPDLERSADFYGSLMGWTTRPTSDTHRFFVWKGKIVASLQKISERKAQWVPHVSVESIEKTSDAAIKLGATLVENIDIEGVARTATFRDSEATQFGLWQPASHPGIQLTEVVGSLWWVEVLSNDAKRARKLYTQLFGWTTSEKVFEPFSSYIFFKRGEIHESGVLPIDPGWEIQPRWNSIFAVEDCDATVAHALQMGADGEFVHTVPTAGRIGVFNDPVGAFFLVRGPVPH
jgi:predicted enzyme related to lactoylglutathione lyase